MKKIISKVGDTISQSVDFVVDKNRQVAQLNRLKAVISAETETLNNAYIALGKMYVAKAEGAEVKEEDAVILIETVNASKLRLKKARARYEYTLKYGAPKPGFTVEETIDIDEVDENGKKKDTEAEDQDITIAYADPTAEIDDDTLDAAIDSAVQETEPGSTK